jgi:hypothetical protein
MIRKIQKDKMQHIMIEYICIKGLKNVEKYHNFERNDDHATVFLLKKFIAFVFINKR